MIRQSALLGHSCAAGANIIWGMMAPIAKVVMVGGLVTPLVLTDLRIFGAAVLFWLASFFAPYEKVAKADLFRLFLASLFLFRQRGTVSPGKKTKHSRQNLCKMPGPPGYSSGVQPRLFSPQVHSSSSTFISDLPRAVRVYSTLGGICG